MSTGQDHPATGGDAPEVTYRPVVDQVVRRMNFSAAHPEVGIVFYSGDGRWEATVPGRRKMVSTELRRLLDSLEEHFR
jgi:hypothetical protein